MKGIKLSHGVTFVECDGITIRINADGTCELSPILLSSLEWELRTEPPASWDYLSQSDFDSMVAETRQQIEQIVARFHEIIGQ